MGFEAPETTRTPQFAIEPSPAPAMWSWMLDTAARAGEGGRCPMADRTRCQTRSHRAQRRATKKFRRTAQRQLAGETVPDANDVPMRPARHMAPRYCFAAITGPPRIRPAGVRAAAGHQTVRRTAQRQLAGETVPDANDVPMRPARHMAPRFCFAATAEPH